MMNSLGIGVMIPSTTMRPKIPGYPTAATKFVIHSVRPKKREGTRAEPGAPESSFGWRYHPANPLRDELALLGDQLTADERRRWECRLRALERGPPALVSASARRHLLDPPRVDHQEVGVAPDRDLPLVRAQELGGVFGEHRDEPLEREDLAADVPEQDGERRRDPGDAGGRGPEPRRFLPRRKPLGVLAVCRQKAPRFPNGPEDAGEVRIGSDGDRVAALREVHLERGGPLHFRHPCRGGGSSVQAEVHVRASREEANLLLE